MESTLLRLEVEAACADRHGRGTIACLEDQSSSQGAIMVMSEAGVVAIATTQTAEAIERKGWSRPSDWSTSPPFYVSWERVRTSGATGALKWFRRRDGTGDDSGGLRG